MKRGLALLPLALLASCTFGGPSGNPDDYVAFDAGVDAAPADGLGSHGDDAAAGPADADSSVAPGDDASPGDAGPSGQSGDAGPPDALLEGGACTTPVAVCDPVHNTGCNPLQQCDVDTSQTSTPTGICVFNGGSDAGGSCTMSLVSESCPPQHTCVGGICRALCSCNADCPIGRCCSDASGPKGFTLCGACP